MPGVYLLSQICVVLAFYAVFQLGIAIVGIAHATIAVMLMVGISVFNIVTPEFGSSVLAMPITAFMLLHFWRALGEGRRGYWSALAVETGLTADDQLCRADHVPVSAFCSPRGHNAGGKPC